MDWILNYKCISVVSITSSLQYSATHMQQKTKRKGKCNVQHAVLRRITDLVCFGSRFIMGLKTGIRRALLQIGAIH